MCYWLIIGFHGFILPLFAPLVMQWLEETLNSSSLYDLLYRAQYWGDMKNYIIFMLTAFKHLIIESEMKMLK